ncbi:hypothetical protein E3Q18_04458 [Wallemia mellicola]|uniref:Ima1 N-terminal domain-containing protein n=1 Tax=Wallemia mellicola TaxID=1708541 RepID=A0A4T0QCQ8_9BASI|nr:hypothetical protein E3Q18_04458 [Wallemia mellicola]TIB94986.1 hypothetical protein E3Q17_04414 [Wallemia mellicola]TIB97267.1 hypothetical protein E3Q16_04430 [Wallemia mellicola]TIC06638.1 hypothetical protein E3Q14_04438 [Wallemia mellicola]TIC21254.1 hypothetical protein E3Q11_04443 [Wallemia mellicola]
MITRKPKIKVKQCHYCLEYLEVLNNNFKCTNCDQFNNYDDKGQLIDNYAPLVNKEALKYKAKPLTITQDTINPFCNSCSTNQTLIYSLLSNYDNDNDDDLTGYNNYKNSIESRYPPICSNCQIIVNQTINKRNYKAKTKALGQWLEKSASLNDGSSNTLRNTTFNGPLAIPLSILYSFWDPTWLKVHNIRSKGQSLVLTGKRFWIQSQFIIWLERSLLLGSLAFQSSLEKYYTSNLALSLLLLEITSKQPTISKNDETQAKSYTNTPDFTADNLSSALSLSVDSKVKKLPIFGETSLQPSEEAQRRTANAINDTDEMEWTPEQNLSNPKSHSTWAGLKPQLFFAPQDNQKTGLEEPLSSVSLSISDSNVYKRESNQDNKKMLYLSIKKV